MSIDKHRKARGKQPTQVVMVREGAEPQHYHLSLPVVMLPGIPVIPGSILGKYSGIYHDPGDLYNGGPMPLGPVSSGMWKSHRGNANNVISKPLFLLVSLYM